MSLWFIVQYLVIKHFMMSNKLTFHGEKMSFIKVRTLTRSIVKRVVHYEKNTIDIYESNIDRAYNQNFSDH